MATSKRDRQRANRALKARGVHPLLAADSWSDFDEVGAFAAAVVEAYRLRERLAVLEPAIALHARAEGWSWDRIGQALGVSRETARNKWAPRA